MLSQEIVDSVGKFFSDFIFGWQNMASIHVGDLEVKKLPSFYELCPACVNVVTMKFPNPVYYKSTWSENFIDI